jgi:hypothetical protein
MIPSVYRMHEGEAGMCKGARTLRSLPFSRLSGCMYSFSHSVQLRSTCQGSLDRLTGRLVQIDTLLLELQRILHVR